VPYKVIKGVFSMFLKSDHTPDPVFNFNLAPAKEVQNTLIVEVEVEVELWRG
jgi:hypothetical protein